MVNRKMLRNVAFVVLCIAAVGTILFLSYKLNRKNIEMEYLQKTQSGDLYLDRSAEIGIMPGMTDEEIQKRLNQVVEDGMMNVSMNADIYFDDGSAEGEMGIENVEANHYNYQIIVELDETGDEVYRSGMLPPGYYIEKSVLSKVLSKGDYPATARFVAYQEGESQPIGSAALKIVLHILN